MADEQQNVKIYSCRYLVENLVFMLGEQSLQIYPANIINIEYANDYEFNLRAIIKISLRMDIRKKLWILKNKHDIVVKFELSKCGINNEEEHYVTAVEGIWNEEFGLYLSDDDENIDITNLETRLGINEGESFNINDIENESYFESENILDVFLFNQSLLNASNSNVNKVFTSDTLQRCVAALLTETKHKKVLMSKFENSEVYTELLIPPLPVYKALIYLDQYYGFYKKGAMIYYDADVLYILNLNGKITAKREDEWIETTILVSSLENTTPSNPMVRKENEKINYISISETQINSQKFSINKNSEIGSEAKIVITDDVEVDTVEADQSYISQRNETIVYRRKDDNKYTTDIMKARMEENECLMYISIENVDISAFTPNKIYQIIFEETTKQEKYGKNKYRLAYAYHNIITEGELYMRSVSQIMLKKVSS